MSRIDEGSFFAVFSNRDIWENLRYWIRYYYKGKKTSNFYNYTNSKLAIQYGYFSLFLEDAPKLIINESVIE